MGADKNARIYYNMGHWRVAKEEVEVLAQIFLAQVPESFVEF